MGCRPAGKLAGMRAFRTIFIMIAISGGMAAPILALRGLKTDGSGKNIYAIPLALVGLIGALPGLMLLWLATPRSIDLDAIRRADSD